MSKVRWRFSVSALLLSTLVAGLVLANSIAIKHKIEPEPGIVAIQTTRGFPLIFATTIEYQYPEDMKGLRKPSGGSYNMVSLTGNIFLMAIATCFLAPFQKLERLKSLLTQVLKLVTTDQDGTECGETRARKIKLNKGTRFSKRKVISLVCLALGAISLGNALAHFGVTKVPWLVASVSCFGIAALGFTKKPRLVAILGVVTCIASGGLAIHEHQSAKEEAVRAERYRSAGLRDYPHLAVGKTAPEIVAPDLSGVEMKLSQYRGKVVMLVFWASWCGPCMGAVKHELELHHHFSGRPFAIVGVNGDSTPARGLDAKKDSGIAWRSFQSGPKGQIVRDFGVQGWPAVYLINQDGVIQYKGAHGRFVDERIEELVLAAEQREAERKSTLNSVTFQKTPQNSSVQHGVTRRINLKDS